MDMLHKSNREAISQWSAKDYANKYRQHLETRLCIESWFYEFMPEVEEFNNICAFCRVCEKFHNMGF